MPRIGKGFIVVDSTGVIGQGPFTVVGFLGIASGDNPACVIEDIEGNPVYEIASGIAGKRYFPFTPASAIKIDKPNCITFTNMKRCILYLE